MASLPLTRVPRWVERKGATEAEHLIALDNDADTFESAVYTINKGHEALSDKLDRLNARMFGVIVSLSSAAIALAANLVLHR